MDYSVLPTFRRGGGWGGQGVARGVARGWPGGGQGVARGWPGRIECRRTLCNTRGNIPNVFSILV